MRVEGKVGRPQANVWGGATFFCKAAAPKIRRWGRSEI